MYCVAAHEHPVTKNAFRAKQYEKHFDEFKDWKHEFPMTISLIPKFEKQFNKSINVYRYETIYDSETKNHKINFNPLYVTSNISKPDKWINLLLITEGARNHYVLIKSMSALLHDNYNNDAGHHATHLCPFCFKTYRTMDLLTAHFDNGCKRFGEKTEFPSIEKSKGYVRFTKLFKMLKKPFVIYADFESLLQECDDKGKYQKHITCGYAYKIVASVEKYNKDIVLYRPEDEKIDVAKHFVKSILKEADNIIRIMKDIVPMNLTNNQQKQFNNANECYLCGCDFKADDVKVRDHDHLTGEYRGAAHNACNLNYGTGKLENYKIPVVFHNLKGYDSHFIVKALSEKFKKIECIPSSSTEKFTSFSVNNLQFIDSLSFIQASLETLVDNLSQSNINNINSKFKHFNKGFKNMTDQQKILLTQKGVYPYDYMSSFDKFQDIAFPTIEQCYSRLNKEDLNNESYERAQNVWKSFNVKNMGEYHDLYLKTDVLLLADVFENFRSNCIKSYSLDPVHYYTLPGFAWDACLKMTGVKLDVFSEEQNDMYLMVERGLRGGISVISHRHSKANNKYLSDYDSKQPSKYIMYLDANNLYGYSMIQSLPVDNFQWADEVFDENKILKMTDDQATGYIFDVDLEYPETLHDLHNDYPLAPERVKISKDEISPHSQRILKILEAKQSPTEKLMPNLKDKSNYVTHYRNLKLYLELGMKIKKVNKVISFSQSPWLKQYIDFNTNKRKEATEDFEKDMYKLMNNAVFGKTMENVRKRTPYELVSNQKRYQKLINDPSFKNCVFVNDNLCGITRSHTTVRLDKPIAIGFSILELSKVLMYDFHYNVMKPKYDDKIKLLFTDTDSLCYEIQTNDIYEDMKSNAPLYDFSEYPKTHVLHSMENKKVIGKLKDETGSIPIREFVGLRSKMYAFQIFDPI